MTSSPIGDGSEGTVRATVESMAMPFFIEIAIGSNGPPRDEVQDAIRGFHRDLEFADEVFSLWRDDTPLSRLSRREITADDCPPVVADVLAECERYRVETDGFFDARRPDGVLDPTGVVKSWAVVRGAWRFDALGAQGWMIGGSGDVLASGSPEGGRGWRVGIADPRQGGDPQAGPVLDMVVLGGGLDGGFRAVATSGIAQNGEHIWNPRTGMRRAAYAQVSVVGMDLVECDAWATASVAGGGEVARAAQRRGLEVLCVPLGVEAGASVAAEASSGWPGLASS